MYLKKITELQIWFNVLLAIQGNDSTLNVVLA